MYFDPDGTVFVSQALNAARQIIITRLWTILESGGQDIVERRKLGECLRLRAGATRIQC